MSKKHNRKLSVPGCMKVLAVLFLLAGSLGAEVRLPAVFGSHIVLQRDIPVKIWGWAEPGEAVRLQLAGQSANVKADASGRWEAIFKPLAAGGEALTLAVKGSFSSELKLEDIVVGEVWVCSGQSNMELTLAHTHSPSAEIQQADYPGIRLFFVPRRTAVTPQEDLEGEWTLCRPETARDFSAVAYYFGREIHLHQGVPVGLISTSWGGTRIEPWTPPEGFKAVPEVTDLLDEVDASAKAYLINVGQSLPDFQKWVKEAVKAVEEDADPPLPPDLPDHLGEKKDQKVVMNIELDHP
jgi:sialate O-acetylesterase